MWKAIMIYGDYSAWYYQEYYMQYLAQGYIIETNTFKCRHYSMQDYDMQRWARQINLSAAKISRWSGWWI